MKRKSILITFLMIAVFLSGCSDEISQKEDIKTGDIKDVVIEDFNSDKSGEEPPCANNFLKDLYSRDENREIYIPKEFTYTDKNGIEYKRRNLPDYGISVLVPKGFKLKEIPTEYLKDKIVPMISVYGTDEKTQGIQLSFFAKSTEAKAKRYIQETMYKDIMDRYIYIADTDTFSPLSLKNGDIEEILGVEKVNISEDGRNYIEIITSKEGVNYKEGRKLKTWREKPEQFRLHDVKRGSIQTALTIFNYGVVFDKATLVITTHDINQESIANEINRVVSESVMYLDTEESYDVFANSYREDSTVARKTVNIPNNFKVTIASPSHMRWVQDIADYNTLSNQHVIEVFYHKLAKNSPEILDSFHGLQSFKEFMNVRYDSKAENIGFSENSKYYKIGKSLSNGFYQVTMKGIKEEGVYNAVYFENTGELFVFMMNSNEFTRDMKIEELKFIVDSLESK